MIFCGLAVLNCNIKLIDMLFLAVTFRQCPCIMIVYTLWLQQDYRTIIFYTFLALAAGQKYMQFVGVLRFDYLRFIFALCFNFQIDFLSECVLRLIL